MQMFFFKKLLTILTRKEKKTKEKRTIQAKNLVISFKTQKTLEKV